MPRSNDQRKAETQNVHSSMHATLIDREQLILLRDCKGGIARPRKPYHQGQSSNHKTQIPQRIEKCLLIATTNACSSVFASLR